MEILTGLCMLLHAFIIDATSPPEKVVLLDTIADDWRGWSTNTEKYSGWRSQNLPPNGDRVFGVCMLMKENNNNWLYSPVIPTGEANSIIIETFFSMRNCRNYPEPSKMKTCEEMINMLTYETDEIKDSSHNNKIFKQTAVLFPEKKWSQNEQEQPMMNVNKVPLPVKTLGLQLAYKDTGSCTMIRRVRVYYLVCPVIVTSFMEFPRTVAKHGYDLASAHGTCVYGAMPRHHEEVQSRFCQSNGMWHDMGVESCHCAPGYTPSTDWKSCIPCAKGSYKPLAGVERCSYCPKNSQSQPGQMRCRCDDDFYQKTIGSGVQAKNLCLQPPKAPEELKANVTDGYAVVLSWKYPQLKDPITRDDIDYFHVSCTNCKMDQVVVSPSVNITQLSVSIIGLDMGENYFFSVTSVASASNYSTVSQLSNPSRASVYFSLPKTNGLQMNQPRIDQNDNVTLTMSWTRPRDVFIDMYMLQICSILAVNSTLVRSQCEYQFTIVDQHLYSFNARCISVTLRIRYKSNGVWSDYSSNSSIKVMHEENIFTKPEMNDRLSAETQSIFQWFPNLEVILLFVTSGVLVLILVSVSVILMRRHVYRAMKQSNETILSKEAFFDNTKSSYASITASSPSRGRSYFYLSSVDNSGSQQKPLEEIPSNLIIMRTLDAKGNFYDIYNACLKQPRKLPMKVTLYALISKPEINKRLLDDAHEIVQFQHENILSTIGICSANVPPLIVLQNMTHGSLNRFLKRYHSSIDKSQLLLFLRDIACGLCYLSERKFIIKRVTSHRIYIDDCFVCKVSVSMREWNNEIPARNEIAWKAPELYDQNLPTVFTDIWAFGVVMWEVFSFGEQPYWNWTCEVVTKSVIDGYRLPAPVNCSQTLRDLMSQCWSMEPTLRPLFPVILLKLDVSINYVDDKLLLVNSSQRFLISADLANHSDCAISNDTVGSMETSCHLSDTHRDVSIDNLTNHRRYSSLREIKHSSSKRSRLSVTNGNNSARRITIKSGDDLNKRSQRRSSNVQRHIKGTNVNLNTWLSEINMKKYKKIMTKNGYNNRSKLVNVSIADLTEMGIRKASDIQLLINTIQKLKSDESV